MKTGNEIITNLDVQAAREMFKKNRDIHGREVPYPVPEEAFTDEQILARLKAACELLKAIPSAPRRHPALENWVEEVMAQAQVFASAWALVGSRFDSGDGLAVAEAAKAELRKMLEKAL